MNDLLTQQNSKSSNFFSRTTAVSNLAQAAMLLEKLNSLTKANDSYNATLMYVYDKNGNKVLL